MREIQAGGMELSFVLKQVVCLVDDVAKCLRKYSLMSVGNLGDANPGMSAEEIAMQAGTLFLSRSFRSSVKIPMDDF